MIILDIDVRHDDQNSKAGCACGRTVIVSELQLLAAERPIMAIPR